MLTQTDAEKLGFLWCGKEFCQPWPYSNKSSPDRGFDPFGGGVSDPARSKKKPQNKTIFSGTDVGHVQIRMERVRPARVLMRKMDDTLRSSLPRVHDELAENL